MPTLVRGAQTVTIALWRDPSVREEMPDGRFRYPNSGTRLSADEHAKIVGKIVDAYLGPWCPDCGKKGKRCSDRRREACRLRAILANKGRADVSLPNPPDEWAASRGYGRITSDFYAGGRWKRGTRSRLVTWLSESQRREMRRHYAYEVAMGRDAVADEAIAA